jgi:isocitrate dehydrogenase kinase/phosphatase
MAQGIQEQDWRFKGIMDLLDGCDKAFEQGDWAAFQRLAEKAKTLCQKK